MVASVQIPRALRERAIHYWGEQGRIWVEGLPQTIAYAVRTFGVTLGRPYDGANTGYVARATVPGGSAAVLKVCYPGIVGEAEALAAYDGNGAVRLYDYDPEHRALLIERCRPGTPLRAVGDPEVIVSVACSIAVRLWAAKPPSTVPTLVERVAPLKKSGAAVLAGASGPGLDGAALDLATEGLALLGSLAEDPVTERLLHGDLHPVNILQATREPWLAVDPKALRGDPAYEPIACITETPTGTNAPIDGAVVTGRISRFGELLDCSPARIAAWGFARRVDWALFCHSKHDYTGARRSFEEAGWFRDAARCFASD